MQFDTIKRLYTRDEIHKFIQDVWKTDLFRKAHYNGIIENDPRSGGFVFDIVEDFAKLPRFAFEMSNERLEWAHFSTWWGGIPYRKYDNPYIHDLYWLHEMAHAGNMVYVPDMNLANFERKMTDNELHASVVSEIQVYFEIPELRALSFTHPIYADRFLDFTDMRERYKRDPKLTFEEMKVIRRNTMMDANATRIADKWIHRFYMQNAAWVACWAHRYNAIECAMSSMRNCVLAGKDRKFCLDVFVDGFLPSHSGYIDKDNPDAGSIPFKREAEAFAGVYWANRGHYDDAMKWK
jgi:hypothetical protein